MGIGNRYSQQITTVYCVYSKLHQHEIPPGFFKAHTFAQSVLSSCLPRYCFITSRFSICLSTWIGDDRCHYPKANYFWIISAASVLIAAAGYIINDYFDLNIDRVNKPDKLVVEKIIKRRWAIIWHWVLSGAGRIAQFLCSWKTRTWWLGLANMGCVLLLWFY